MIPTRYEELLGMLDEIDPIRYASSRNYTDGAVTRLSPYISRGLFSTRQIAKSILNKNYRWQQAECLIKELAWRDYFQQVWRVLKNDINQDIKQIQQNVKHHDLPKVILEANTGITSIDTNIQSLYEHGYMHNHVRMYVASICCNIAQSHWLTPAKWMYYHLLDADWASNALSWQWISGSFSSKKYYANQENINRFTRSNQHQTFLDTDYETLEKMSVPLSLQYTNIFEARTPLPETPLPDCIPELPVYLYTFYNLDPLWDSQVKANRVLILEPSMFEQYPVKKESIDFMLLLSKNILDIQVYTGEFSHLKAAFPQHTFHFKEHPLSAH
ncbi:MAG TPA: deoxyribodipyrimidine photolyase, partial [Chitinophagaceae bacterium]|nr:deoxyribodipyrimidine photolyase [Chitinophagaceae bacterium]